MTALDMSVRPVDDRARSASVPLPRCLTSTPTDRIIRQVQGIDAWNAAMRLRQALRHGSSARHIPVDGASQLDVLRRTHAAVARSTARELARPLGPMLYSTPTAVLAHHHRWFRDEVCALLTRHGFDVVEQTDNAPDALGAIIAEQPDLVLVGGRLAMMTTSELLSETALFSPMTVRLEVADVAGHSLRAADDRAAVHHGWDDEGVARVAGALCDPFSLRLVLHAVAVGEFDVEAASLLGSPGNDTVARLDELVGSGLLVRSRTSRRSETYRLPDAAAMRRMLAAVRRLGARPA